MLQTVVSDVEGIHLVHVAGGEALVEPPGALLGSAVREGVGSGAAISLLLEEVVADLAGAVHRLLDVALLEAAEELVLVVAPYACQEVCLKLQTDAVFVGRHFIGTRAYIVDLLQDTEFVLDMVADFVRDHIGVREISPGLHLVLHLREETQVDIQAFVGRTIERPRLRSGIAAARLNRTGEEHHGGRIVSAAHLLEHLGPYVLGAGQDLTGELGKFLLLLGEFAVALGLGGNHAAQIGLRNDTERIAAEKPSNEGDDGYAADAHSCNLAAAERPAVVHVAAGSSSFQIHLDIDLVIRKDSLFS